MPDPAVPTPPVAGDTAAAPTAPPVAPDAAAAQTNDPVADATTNLTHAVKVAPALLKAPAAAYDVATAGGDIDSSAQAASVQGSRHVAAQVSAVAAQAHPDHPGGLWGALDDLGHRVAHDTAQVYEDPAKILELPLDAMNVTMKESQHQFRYLYDVYERHGLMAALGETAVMLAAGAAGVAVTAAGVLGTPFSGGASDVAAGAADAALAGVVEGGEVGLEGAASTGAEEATESAAQTGAKDLLKKGFKTGGKVLNKLAGPTAFTAPAQAAGYAESHAIYRDSWNRTANPQYKNKDGMLVNPGNVLDGLLGLKGEAGAAMSGVTNGIYDLFTDPTNGALTDWGEARQATSDVVKFGKVYNRSIDSDNMLRAYDAAKAGTGTRQDGSMLRAVQWMAAHGATDINRKFPQFASLIDTVKKAADDPAADEDLVSRYDSSDPGNMDPNYPQGAYGTPEGSPSSYAAHGGVRTEFFIKKANQLPLTRSPDGKAYNAGTAAIRELAGPKELDRLIAMRPETDAGAKRVVDEMNEKWGLHLPYTRKGDELDIYGAELARRAGYKSMRFAEPTPGYNDEIVALHNDAIRHSGTPLRMIGLADAKTDDEVMHVLTRENLAKEGMGKHAPSMSMAGEKMDDLRVKAMGSKMTPLHPILGSVRHPSAALGNIGLLTSRAVGEPHAMLNLGTLAPEGMTAFRRQLVMSGMSPDLIERLIDGIRNADVAGRQTIYRNAQFMALLAHAGILKEPEDLTDMNWFNDTKETLMAKLAKKPKFRDFVVNQLNNITKMAENTNPDSGLYEMTDDGTTPAPFVDGERRQAGAILRNQTGDVPIMDWSELHHAAQKVAGRMRFTGDLDDFLMTHVTDPIFKRWVLVSLGYVFHVSASEIALNAPREGTADLIGAAWKTSLQRMGARVTRAEGSAEELMSVKRSIYNMVTHATPVPGTTKSFNRIRDLLTAVSVHGQHQLNEMDEKELGYLTDYFTVNPTGVGPETMPHGSTIDSLSDVGATNGGIRGMLEQSRMIHGDRYVNYGPADAEHLTAWAAHLGVTAQDPASQMAAKAAEAAYAAGGTSDDAYDAAQKAALKALNDMDPIERSNMMADRLKRDGDPAHITPRESWSHHTASNVMAATHAPGRTEVLHGTQGSLLHNVASGSYTAAKDLRQIPQELRPLGVPGRELIQGPGAGVMAHLSTGIYGSVLNPTIRTLSRQPIAFAAFRRNMIDGERLVQAGVMTHEDLVLSANKNADVEALRYVHNIHDRTVLDQMMRNWVPFFFAQEQAYRRAGRLLASDPGAFRKYELMLQSAHNIVSKQEDGSGNQYFALPGAGFLDSQTTRAFGLIGIPLANLNPTGFGGTLSAASVVFPAANGVRPDFSPVVTISAQAVQNLFEEWGAKYSTFKPVVNVVQGGLNEALGSENMQESILQQVIPNTTAYRFIEAAEGNDTSFNSAMMLTMQSLAYSQNVAMEKWRNEGSKGPEPDIIPPPDASPEQLQAFLSKVKNQTRIVFLQRAILGAVSPVSADVTVNDFGLNAKLQADINSSKSVDAGFQKFLLANPDATPYTTAESTTATGKSLPDTQGALDWIESNSSLLNKYQYGGMWLMPNLKDNTYSSSAYYNEIADGLRQRLAPSAYLNALYTANGDQTYYTALAEHEAIIAGAGSGSATESQEYARWDAYMQHLQATQPIWWASYNSGTRQSDAQQSINQLTEIYAKGLEPKTQQSEDVGNLLTAFQSAESQYVQAGTQSNYSTAQKQISDSWINYCDQLALQEPQLASVISSVFRDGLVYMNQT